MSDQPVRPRRNDIAVMSQAAAEIVPEVHDWACKMKATTVAPDDKEFRALITLAILESADSYQALRYLDDFLGWPVGPELASIFDKAFARMPRIADDMVMDWVLATGARFPAKAGQGVNVKIGDVEFVGKVEAVIRKEARGIVRTYGSNRQAVSVLAEEVLDTFEVKEKPAPVSPPTEDDYA